MKPREQVVEDVAPLSIEGLQVEEARDEDTIRRFMREWRERAHRKAAFSPYRHGGSDAGRARPPPR